MLRGGCYEYEATTPYLPFVEALRRWVREHQSDDALRRTARRHRRRADRGSRPRSRRDSARSRPAPPLEPHEERLRLFDDVARAAAGRWPRERGVLLFLDDLHWADHGTLALLHYLLRHLRDERLLVLGAYREIELDRAHPLAAALVDWNRERLATRIALGRLSPRRHRDACSAALFGQDAVSDDFAGAVHRETEGNPFFVEEVVKSLIEQGQIYRDGGEWQRCDDRRAGDPAEREGGDRPPARPG